MTTQELYARAEKLGIEVEGVEVDDFSGRSGFQYEADTDWCDSCKNDCPLRDQHAIDLLCAAIERWLVEQGWLGYWYDPKKQTGKYRHEVRFVSNGASELATAPTKLEALLLCAEAVKKST